MKTYEEIAAELFDRRDAYYARRARQRKMALAAASGLCCMALVVLLGFGLRHNMETIPAAGDSNGTAAAPAVPDISIWMRAPVPGTPAMATSPVTFALPSSTRT